MESTAIQAPAAMILLDVSPLPLLFLGEPLPTLLDSKHSKTTLLLRHPSFGDVGNKGEKKGGIRLEFVEISSINEVKLTPLGCWFLN